jgi:hypothetical protein
MTFASAYTASRLTMSQHALVLRKTIRVWIEGPLHVSPLARSEAINRLGNGVTCHRGSDHDARPHDPPQCPS